MSGNMLFQRETFCVGYDRVIDSRIVAELYSITCDAAHLMRLGTYDEAQTFADQFNGSVQREADAISNWKVYRVSVSEIDRDFIESLRTEVKPMVTGPFAA